MTEKKSRFSTMKSVKQMKSGEAEDQPKETGKGVKRFKNPDYIQTTVYIQRDTHKALKVAMAEDEIGFADLVERLIEEWLQARKS